MPPSAPAKEPHKTTLSQGIEIVRHLLHSRRALGVTEVASQLGLAKSSAFRLLSLFGEIGFVQKKESTQRYTISPEIFHFIHELAHQFGRNHQLEAILRKAAQELKCSVYLSMLAGRVTSVVSAVGEYGNTYALGSPNPVFAGSAGKIMVAHMPEELWRQYAPTAEDVIITPYTNLDPEKFYQELRVARETGVAWNMRESTPTHVSVSALVREPSEPPRLAVALVIPFQDLVAFDRKAMEQNVLALAKLCTDELNCRAPATVALQAKR